MKECKPLAMGIELDNAAVIIDEGHNIEDVCREGASLELSVKDLAEAAAELVDVAKYFEDAGKAVRFLNPIANWLKDELEQAGRNSGGHRASTPWAGAYTRPLLSST